MPEYKRVKDKETGHKYSVVASVADESPELFQVLKQDAVDHNGEPLPPEFAESPTSGSGSASSGQPKSGSAENPKKESD